MSCGILDDVKQDAARAVRNLPDAHASWQAFWRNAQFRRVIGRLDKTIYSLDVETLTESQLELVEEAVTLVIKTIEIHMSSLSSAVRDTVDREYFKQSIKSLRTSADALQQGLSPDAAKRPTSDVRLKRFEANIRRANLA